MLALCGGCSPFTRLLVDAKPVTELGTPAAQPDPELTAKCNVPVQLKGSALSAGETERDWGQDRTSLVDCGRKKQELQKFYSERDEKLGLTANANKK